MADTFSAAEEGDQSSEPPSTLCAATKPTPPPALDPNATNGTARNWNNWKWQMKNRVRSLAQLAQCVPGLNNHAELERVVARYPMAITPYYASLIRQADESDPVFAQAVPQFCEMV
ncbi:MAG TPA: hypothetical protein VLH60_04675, partial [Sedimentisphaerales bacterium]|nr:hypothetical protein [Sedimentisphaerales bacterium]